MNATEPAPKRLRFPCPGIRPVALVLMVGWMAGDCLAAEPQLADLVSETTRHRRSLSEFVGSNAPIAMEGAHSGLEIEIALSPRIEVMGGEVEILHEHATGQADGRSGLRVSWGDREIGAATVATGERSGRLAGRFTGTPDPVSSYLLKIVSERHGLPAAGAPPKGPWTQIDATGSGIAIDYRLRTLDPMLNEMRDLIDERYWGDYEIGIVTAPLYSVDHRHFAWGNRVAQRAALWMGDRPLEIRHHDQLTGTGDQIAVGTRAEMIGILPKTICDQITTSFVGVYPHPRDARHFLLVLSGTDAEGVGRAVRAFAFAPDEFPALPRIDVTGWEAANSDPPAAGPEGSRHVQMPDLARWQASGFPGVAGGKDAPGCDLWITSRDSGTLAGAWMVAGKLAQISGDVALSLAVVDRQPDASRHWLALGPIGTLDGALVGASPLARLQPAEGEGFLTQFESPLHRGRAGGFLTAADSLILRERVTELIRPTLWESLHGDTALWALGGSAPRHQRLAATFEVGEPGPLLAVWRLVTALPWLSISLSTLGAIIVVWLLRQPMTSGRDWDLVPVRTNSNRRTSVARRQREVARRKARLADASRRGA